MTPQDYRLIEQHLESIVDSIRALLCRARAEAARCPLPARLRPAVASDIVEGAVLWSPDDDDQHWMIVEAVLHPGDAFKAFVYDGCRYGLDGCYVEIDESPEERTDGHRQLAEHHE